MLELAGDKGRRQPPQGFPYWTGGLRKRRRCQGSILLGSFHWRCGYWVCGGYERAAGPGCAKTSPWCGGVQPFPYDLSTVWLFYCGLTTLWWCLNILLLPNNIVVVFDYLLVAWPPWGGIWLFNCGLTTVWWCLTIKLCPDHIVAVFVYLIVAWHQCGSI